MRVRFPPQAPLKENEMSSFFKIAMFVIGVYTTINWMADNPDKVNTFRENFNDVISTGANGASETISDVVNQ